MRIAFTLVAALSLSSSSAFGWGCDGHQIIALIARANLTPQAAAAVDQLLRDNPIDPALSRFCKDRPSDLMADSATWADDERSADKSTEKWHYIDIPLAVHTGSVPREDAMKWCAALSNGTSGCIVSALDYDLAILRDKTRPAAARATALRYVIHFTGDIAQPLHTVDNHDQGAGCTSIRFFAAERPQTLHSIWDSQLIARYRDAGKLTDVQYAEKLNRDFSGNRADWSQPTADLLGWAWESHNLAESVTYGDLKPRIPVAAATAGDADKDACSIGREQVAALRISIADAYAAQAMPVIREQLAKAGFRLADLLNRTFR
jgi:S1/P1 Nuclease